jgi:hypothetical protein
MLQTIVTPLYRRSAARARLPLLMIGAIFFLESGSVRSHHSSSLYDGDVTRSLSGSVKEFQWTNPHCWIQLLVRDSNGSVVEWSIEMGPPMNALQRHWKRTTIVPGDEIIVTVHPARDNSPTALFLSATRADGAELTAPRHDDR